MKKKNSLVSNPYKAEDVFGKLEAPLSAFSQITGVPVTCYDVSGAIISEFGADNKLCNDLGIYLRRNSGCRKLLSFAGEFSSNLGEPYIFLCKAGFSNISMPVIVSGEFMGYAIAGPFILKKLRRSTVNSVLNMNRVPDGERLLIEKKANNMRVLSSQEITALSVLFSGSVRSSLISLKDYDTLSKVNEEQKHISSRIRASKNELTADREFSPDMEKKLVSDIIKGDLEEADRLIRKLLERFSIITVGNIDEVKTMSLWVAATVVKSLSNEVSIRSGDTLDVDIDIMNRITEADSVDALAQAFLYIIRYVSNDLISSIYTGSSQLVNSGLKYIKDHFSSKITLADMCAELHVNPSYFSNLFSQEMGQTFVEYLTDLRLSKAEDLLVSTNMSMLDISVSTGFENQSYFTKVFKSAKGMTPREYRRASKEM